MTVLPFAQKRKFRGCKPDLASDQNLGRY